jgi:beta-glucuronidase
MPRRYRDHARRPVVDLAGAWDFVFLGGVDPASVDPTQLAFDDVMPVPGCFDATPKYAARRGVGAYRTRFELPPGCADPPRQARRLRIEIDGAHHHSLTYVGGKLAGTHSGGFTRFHHDTELDDSVADAPIELVILVDNAFSPRSPLHLEHFDWYHYGGLSRGVRVHVLGRTFIDRLRVSTVDLQRRLVQLSIDYQTLDAGASAPLVVRANGRVVLEESCRLEAASGVLERRIELPEAQPWSPESPNLQLLDVQLAGDDRRERIGLRTVSVQDRTLLINGVPLRIAGVNRHEAHPHFGHAVPLAVQLGDLHWLERMGANFVRGSHYPQDSAFLDLCDERGICVWNEAIGWQHGPEQLTSPDFVAAQSAHIEEMMRMSENHPSVVCWGILNESASDQAACRPTYERLIVDLVDIVSVNTYPGWYFETVENIPTWLDQLLAQLRAAAPRAALLVSEIGAGAIYGWRDQNEQHWTEDYQSLVIERAVRHLLAPDTDACGVLIWHFADCRIGQNARAAMGRPRGYNNKGLLDEFRRPKLAFDTARRHFAQTTRGGPRSA